MKYGTNNAKANDYHTRLGYLQASNDTSKTGTTAGAAATLENVGHTFGRLGEGSASYPLTTTAFYWGDKLAANTPGMLVSIFPEADTDTGIDTATTKSVTIIAKAVAWANNADFKAPDQPGLPAEPKKDPRASSASSIGAGLIASVAALFSLY